MLTWFILCGLCTVYHESFKAEKFCGFRAFCMSVKVFYMNVQDGFKGKYGRFRKRFFVKVCLYNLLQNFSASKLSWYTVCV